MINVVNNKITNKEYMTPIELVESAICVYITNLLLLKYGFKYVSFSLNFDIKNDILTIYADDNIYQKIKNNENEITNFLTTLKTNKIERG